MSDLLHSLSCFCAAPQYALEDVDRLLDLVSAGRGEGEGGSVAGCDWDGCRPALADAYKRAGLLDVANFVGHASS